MNQEFKQSEAQVLDWSNNGFHFLTSLNTREMEKHNKFSKDTMVEHFDSLAPNYDQIMRLVGYPDPAKITQHVNKVL